MRQRELAVRKWAATAKAVTDFVGIDEHTAIMGFPAAGGRSVAPPRVSAADAVTDPKHLVASDRWFRYPETHRKRLRLA